MKTGAATVKAFTVMEMVVIGIVLLVLGVIVVPQFCAATADAQWSALRTNLQTIRGQLELYRVQHRGDYPAYARFEEQITQYTNVYGESRPARDEGHKLGPYLLSVPKNPFTGTNDLSNDDDVLSAWYYNEQTGEFRANDGDASREAI